MENVNKNKKVGAGIITMSILYLLGQVFIILGSIINIIFKDQTNKLLAEAGTGVEITTIQLVIALIIALIITIAVILILCKICTKYIEFHRKLCYNQTIVL